MVFNCSAPRRAWLAPAVLALALALQLAGSAAQAQTQAVPEHELKAAFVFNFAVFTAWPAEALASGAALNICVYAGNSLLPALGALNEKIVNGHKVNIRLAGAGLRDCQVLFLDSLDRERWSSVRHELAGASVLTVSDDHAISADGTAIALSLDNRRIAFDVDLNVVRQARLNLSSKLLRLARSVQ